ncbi:MAG TPA: c-type cytochrome [Terracidiphilus sp.]|nr:c-type cytochrome [Terracidiphilus sp.]
MNYPVWDLSFGAGLLIAIVATLHVFVSHFAVGGGLFLVVTEHRARRRNDLDLLGWLKRHTKFFVLVTVVFGAISGVGIWFTIGLISPSATSDLIHIFVWGWAIEWVFFFIEITAALLYMYGWDKLDAGLHEWYGWIYFIAAYLSLVIINGIITFMLTSGTWTKNHQFWNGFFNPTYFPSLAFRTAIALALAGIYALVTASVQKDAALKARIVRWSAWWIVPSLAVLPALGWWYIHKIPPDVWQDAHGLVPTVTRFAGFAWVLLIVVFALALLSLVRPAKMHLAFSLLVGLVAFGAMASFEFVRESVRLPFVISHYLYANSLYSTPIPGDGGFSVDEIDNSGVLPAAKWIDNRTLTSTDQVAVGHEIFRVECESCHTPSAYRGLKQLIDARQWDQSKLKAMLGGLEFMHNGAMPPFAGTDQEQAALAAYLTTVAPVTTAAANAATDGKTIYTQNCIMCHQVSSKDPLFQNLDKNPQTAADSLKDLTTLFPLMPDLKLNDEQRTALVAWINTQRAAGGAASTTQQAGQQAAQGGN